MLARIEKVHVARSREKGRVGFVHQGSSCHLWKSAWMSNTQESGTISTPVAHIQLHTVGVSQPPTQAMTNRGDIVQSVQKK